MVKSSSIKYSLSSSKPIESKEAAGTKNPSPSSNLSYSNPLTTQLLSNSAVKNPSPLSNSSVYKKEKLEEGFLTASASQTSLSNSKIVNPTYDANKEIGIDEKDTKNVVVQSVTDNLEKATSSTTST